jgi:hypothetical protein
LVQILNVSKCDKSPNARKMTAVTILAKRVLRGLLFLANPNLNLSCCYRRHTFLLLPSC